MDDAKLDAWIDQFPEIGELKFNLRPRGLYTVADLYNAYAPDAPGSWEKSYDHIAYDWFYDEQKKAVRPLAIGEAMAARLHDASIEHAINDFILGEPGKVVAFMGGHSVSRADPAYRQVATIARVLRRADLQIVTGGGPGLMEAANLGAFLAPYGDDELDAAVKTLGSFDSGPAGREKWLATASEVRGRLLGGDWKASPKLGSRNLGIPSWLYGNEPPNFFCTGIGKYFYNSVREDGLVNIGSGGLVFGPGSGGTIQEVFQDACVNYYAPGRATPMVFLGKSIWDPAVFPPRPTDLPSHPRPVYPLVRALAGEVTNGFNAAILLSDDAAEVVSFLTGHAASVGSALTTADHRLELVRSKRAAS